jgi:ABC-type sugar transport system permease subunit
MAAISRPSGKVFALKDNKSLFPYLLLAPGLLWFFMFFILPIVNLAQMSTKTNSGETGQFEQTLQICKLY